MAHVITLLRYQLARGHRQVFTLQHYCNLCNSKIVSPGILTIAN